MKLSFDEGDRPVVDQLWDAVRLLINSLVPAMRDLLYLFGVGKLTFENLSQFKSCCACIGKRAQG